MNSHLATRALARHGVHDLAALINLYEGNYARVMRLAPELGQFSGTVVSRVAGVMNLYLTIEERFKYTTTFTLSYRFPTSALLHEALPEQDSGVLAHAGDEFCVLEPNARICVYHDVRAAEVLSHSRRRRAHRTYVYKQGRLAQIERKWEMNRFLFKWLRFCAFQGHLFLECTTSPAIEAVRD